MDYIKDIIGTIADLQLSLDHNKDEIDFHKSSIDYHNKSISYLQNQEKIQSNRIETIMNILTEYCGENKISLEDVIKSLDNVTVVQFPVGVYDPDTKEVLTLENVTDQSSSKLFEVQSMKFDSLLEVITYFSTGNHAFLSIEEGGPRYLIKDFKMD
jgi:hypothetical protein